MLSLSERFLRKHSTRSSRLFMTPRDVDGDAESKLVQEDLSPSGGDALIFHVTKVSGPTDSLPQKPGSPFCDCPSYRM